MRRASLLLVALAAVACSPATSGGGFPFEDVTPTDVAADTATDAATDGPVLDNAPADATPLDNAPVDTAPVDNAPVDTAPVDTAPADTTPADAPSPLIAWGERCMRRSDNCGAPAGERGICSIIRGTPLCMRTCNSQAALSMCEDNRGVCVDGGDGNKYCLPKCGDAERVTCAPGAACAWLGYRTRTDVAGGLAPIGVCLGACTSSGPDACLAPGSACNPTTRTCQLIDCEGMCPAGTTCNSGLCNPPTPAALYTSCSPRPGSAVVCSQNYCVGDTTTTSGFCTQSCDSASGTLSCGSGACFYGSNVTASPAGGPITSYWESAFNVIGGRLTGVCIRGCNTSADCPTRFSCQNYNGVRACVPYSIPDVTTSPGAGLPGSVCRVNSDCATNNCILIAGYRDGLCARASLTTPCPAGTSVLTTAAGATLACARTCSNTRDGDCEGSWRCTTASQCANVGCRSNTDCAAGYTCDVASNHCVTAPPTGGAEIGAPCTADASCRGLACLTPSTTGGVTTWNGGYCTAGCTALQGGGDTCPSGSYCSARNVGALGVCVKLCDALPTSTRFGGCRAGYMCRAFLGDARVGLCLD